MEDNKTKLNGQVFTPLKIVNIILDNLNYTGKDILYKKIMEPSFGEGVFLIEITKRIIEEGLKLNLSKKEIETILNNNIYGIEKDSELFNKTISSLNNVLIENNLSLINWDNLINDDTILKFKNYINKFDFVVGNPPYVRIHNLSKDLLNNIKDFQFIDGIFDLYICFYEIGIKMLNNSGKLGFITPNSFMKNVSQKSFRNYLIDNHYLQAIYDFKTSEIFKGFNTYTCICLLSKDNNESIEYKEFDMYNLVISNQITYSLFKELFYDNVWTLSSKENIDFLIKNNNKKIKLKDKIIVQNGIVTNKDNIYIGLVYEDKEKLIPYMNKHTDEKQLVYFNDTLMESTILHRCVKISRFEGIMNNLYILFPYKLKNNNYIPLNENEFKIEYPLAYNYLLKNKEILATRDINENYDWYLFGRSQGLTNLSYKKIIFKKFINKANPCVIPHILDEDIVVYSGTYITLNIEDDKKYNEELHNICNILKEKDFAKYLSLVGKDKSGGYSEIGSKHIKNYGII